MPDDICPICLRLILPHEDEMEFADYPGPIFHSSCVERKGVSRTRAVLAEHYPVTVPQESEGEAADGEQTE